MEYPKHIDVDGLTIAVTSPEDEARWRAPRAEPPPVAVEAPVEVPAPVVDPPAETPKKAKKGKK